jgi:hypothetical protein
VAAASTARRRLTATALALAVLGCGGDSRPAGPAGPFPEPVILATCRGVLCTFSVVESSSDAPLVSYRWEWGDGGGDTVATATTTHRFAFPGDFAVTVTATDAQNRSGSATRSVVALAEPEGMTVLANRDWNCLLSPLCDSAWGYSDAAAASLALVQDDGAPWSPPSVAEMVFAPGHPGGSAPAVAELYFDAGVAYRTLYLAIWAKFSAGWTGHPSGVNKLVYIQDEAGAPRLYVAALGGGSDPLDLEVALQSLAEPYFDGRFTTETTVNLLPNVITTRRVTRGVWQRFEVELTANSAGVSDGRVRTWLDGVPLHDFGGIRFSGTAAPGWAGIQWAPVWGGVDGVVPSRMTQQMDHLYISGR